jgi:hypothetical protein
MGVGGGTVRAHWETDEDDDTETVRVVVEAPPPPPPPVRRSSNGTAAAASTPTPSPVEQAPSDGPSHNLEDLRREWSSLRDRIWTNPIERAPFLSCELVGVEGSRLVIQTSTGGILMLSDDRKRAIRGKLIELLGKGTDVRFIDDKAPYAPQGPAASDGLVPTEPPLPTNDPVIRKGLQLFGGPLERLPDD